MKGEESGGRERGQLEERKLRMFPTIFIRHANERE
jgi:hypothetical protein